MHSFIYLTLGFNCDPYFCRKERDLEKQNGFPVRLRLGEWNWVEQYEGKRQKTDNN